MTVADAGGLSHAAQDTQQLQSSANLEHAALGCRDAFVQAMPGGLLPNGVQQYLAYFGVALSTPQRR